MLILLIDLDDTLARSKVIDVSDEDGEFLKEMYRRYKSLISIRDPELQNKALEIAENAEDVASAIIEF